MMMGLTGCWEATRGGVAYCAHSYPLRRRMSLLVSKHPLVDF